MIFNPPIAQLVEHSPLKRLVVGSNPTGRTMNSNILSIEIHKPVSEVFKFTTNPKNTPEWIYWMKEEKVNSYPVNLGTEYSNTKDGISWTTYTCTIFEENKKFELQEKNSSYKVVYIYEEISNTETKITYHEWMTDGSHLSEPFNIASLEKLKKVLETE